MGYTIENRGGQYYVVDSTTGSVASGTSPAHQISFAEEQARKLKEVAAQAAAEKSPKRARHAKGQLKADDPDTPDVNEAWEDGKAPKKKKATAKKKATKKKAAKK